MLDCGHVATHNTPMLRQKRAGHEASTPSGGWGFLRIDRRKRGIVKYRPAVLFMGLIMKSIQSTDFFKVSFKDALPCGFSASTSINLTGRLRSISNMPNDFKIKPSFGQSVKSTLKSILCKLVQVFQVRRDTPVPCTGTSATCTADSSKERKMVSITLEDVSSEPLDAYRKCIENGYASALNGVMDNQTNAIKSVIDKN